MMGIEENCIHISASDFEKKCLLSPLFSFHNDIPLISSLLFLHVSHVMFMSFFHCDAFTCNIFICQFLTRFARMMT